MNSSTDNRVFLRGSVADSAATVRFAVDLRRREPGDTPPVQRAKEEARTAGYAEGWAQGQRAAAIEATAALERTREAERAFDQRRAAALAQAVEAAGRAADKLETRHVTSVHDIQEEILAQAFELAEAIIGRTLADPQGRAVDALRRAMSVAPERPGLVVALHPDDYRVLVGTATDTDYNYEGRPVHLRPDPALQPGDAVAEIGATTVDASIAAAVQRAREALRL
ncbi:flagellar assembly protein FliH [Krasilnikovia cinnamomea]|uniref:Flagellar assembly protein FliH n=1 Tax=Krasilnikovia cinnamomea TaxID=349313 RepID=A0A4Q7ZI04_9ACTN|nr:FliH/SctL family protein [Krasilnikovia cinnamomea]RZU50457.1 flagellar assembly protein FliH [Krasilnikovia cinnamomea]